MEAALSRQEYPAMLERLQPSAAAAKLNERVKKIGKINSEIADWLQERRKVEEAYVAGLKKLAKRPLQEVQGDLGIFEGPWRKIVTSTESIAASHATLSQRIEKDVENPLRNFASTNREMSGMTTIQGNLTAMAKELDDALEKSARLNKKGGKSNSQKTEAASSKLQTANQQWDSQAPFIFENLQALDETRLNHLRDVLTQYETHEADQVERNRVTVEHTLSALLELDTASEIRSWSQATTAGQPAVQRMTRQVSNTPAASAQAPSAVPPQSAHSDNASERTSEQSGRLQEKDTSESKLKSRIGTMLGRRRQSVHGGFARAPSPTKGSFPSFGRSSASKEGRPSPSPRASSNNLRDSPARDGRLSALPETPALPQIRNTNGFLSGTTPNTNGSEAPRTPDLSGVEPPPGPPPSHLKAMAETQKDSEGFSVPAAMNDPISQAQQEAADQQQFKLDIRKEPIQEQDADAQAALSSVANTLRSSQAITPSRKIGTVRGRRDVRNTIYVPSANSLDPGPTPDHPLPPSPGIQMGRAAALASLQSTEHTHTSTPSISDTTSIRSGHSIVNQIEPKHTDMHGPGLNASVIETVNATLKDGELQTTSVAGEVALVYNKSDDLYVPETENVRIENFLLLEAIGPNQAIMKPAASDKPDEFTIDTSSISPKPAIAFTYRVHVDTTNMAAQAPILLRPAWKPQGDKLGIVIEYALNPAYSAVPITLVNLVIIAKYNGAKAISCQSKPPTTHFKEIRSIYWKIGSSTIGTEWQKVIARLVGAEGVAPEQGHVEVKWEIQGIHGSGIGFSRLEIGKGKEKDEAADPFADDTISTPSKAAGENWLPVDVSRKLAGGTYEAI